MDIAVLFKTLFNLTLLVATVVFLTWAYWRGVLSAREPDIALPAPGLSADPTRAAAGEEGDVEEEESEEFFEETPESWLDLPEEFLDLGEWR